MKDHGSVNKNTHTVKYKKLEKKQRVCMKLILIFDDHDMHPLELYFDVPRLGGKWN